MERSLPPRTLFSLFPSWISVCNPVHSCDTVISLCNRHLMPTSSCILPPPPPLLQAWLSSHMAQPPATSCAVEAPPTLLFTSTPPHTPATTTGEAIQVRSWWTVETEREGERGREGEREGEGWREVKRERRREGGWVRGELVCKAS